MTELLVVRDEDTAPDLLEALRLLVFRAFEGRFDEHDWEHGCGGWRIVGLEDQVPVSHAAVVERELLVGGQAFAAGYVEAVGTAPGRWGQGWGSRVMAAADQVLRAHTTLGALSTSRHAFYERLGWERWRGPAYVLRDGRPERSPEEDDGLMVLRFGHSAGADLAASLTCHGRPGDDW